MSKGFDWCIKRASDKKFSRLTDRNWKKAIEIPPENFFKMAFRTMIGREIDKRSDDGGNWLHEFYGNVGGDVKHFRFHFLFDPEADFSYFSSDSCLNDGTFLYFSEELMEEISWKVIAGGTADKDVIENGVDFEDVYWTIGNFVVLNEYDPKFAPEGKPWIKSRTTVLLPLKMEVK